MDKAIFLNKRYKKNELIKRVIELEEQIELLKKELEDVNRESKESKDGFVKALISAYAPKSWQQ